MSTYKVAIIGGGVLGTSIAYFLSAYFRQPELILLIEQETQIAYHTSSRNTGKVHAPFLYDPVNKKLFAKAAFLGYEMWQAYAKYKNLVFKQDGVLEVATDERSIERLHKYLEWGEENGLQKSELKLLTREEVKQVEPNVQCVSAIFCSKDASVDYGSLTQSLMEDCNSFGCKFLVGHKVKKIIQKEPYTLVTSQGKKVSADYIINAAGGNAIDVAHSMGVVCDFTDLHFRGEYWQAPSQYQNLTRLSIYSVPKYPEYPFLDPHWIVRADGRREVGPNAVPVFGPYAYTWNKNLTYLLPKIFESSKSGARKIIFDRQFLSLASTELKSSLSKTAMINRVRNFLPQLDASKFVERGTSGIRSSVIDKTGRFMADTMIVEKETSLHILNYNSPGATGALPMAATIVSRLIKKGGEGASMKDSENQSEKKSLWDFQSVADKMEE